MAELGDPLSLSLSSRFRGYWQSECEGEEQRKRMDGVSHNSLFQLAIALKQDDGSQDISLKMKTFVFWLGLTY